MQKCFGKSRLVITQTVTTVTEKNKRTLLHANCLLIMYLNAFDNILLVNVLSLHL